MADKCDGDTHYVGCECHEREWQERVDKLEAQNGAMREALQAVLNLPRLIETQEVPAPYYYTQTCGLCKGISSSEDEPLRHRDYCPLSKIRAALASDAGKELLEELRLKRKMVEVLIEKVMEHEECDESHWVEWAESEAREELTKEGEQS
jgi:hypothetical protein